MIPLRTDTHIAYTALAEKTTIFGGRNGVLLENPTTSKKTLTLTVYYGTNI